MHTQRQAHVNMCAQVTTHPGHAFSTWSRDQSKLPPAALEAPGTGSPPTWGSASPSTLPSACSELPVASSWHQAVQYFDGSSLTSVRPKFSQPLKAPLKDLRIRCPRLASLAPALVYSEHHRTRSLPLAVSHAQSLASRNWHMLRDLGCACESAAAPGSFTAASREAPAGGRGSLMPPGGTTIWCRTPSVMRPTSARSQTPSSCGVRCATAPSTSSTLGPGLGCSP